MSGFFDSTDLKVIGAYAQITKSSSKHFLFQDILSSYKKDTEPTQYTVKTLVRYLAGFDSNGADRTLLDADETVHGRKWAKRLLKKLPIFVGLAVGLLALQQFRKKDGQTTPS